MEIRINNNISENQFGIIQQSVKGAHSLLQQSHFQEIPFQENATCKKEVCIKMSKIQKDIRYKHVNIFQEELFIKNNL